MFKADIRACGGVISRIWYGRRTVPRAVWVQDMLNSPDFYMLIYVRRRGASGKLAGELGTGPASMLPSRAPLVGNEPLTDSDRSTSRALGADSEKTL